MYVCLCQAVKDSEVRQAVASGVEDVDQLAEVLGVGTGCGTCKTQVQAVLDFAIGCGVGGLPQQPEPALQEPALALAR